MGDQPVGWPHAALSAQRHKPAAKVNDMGGRIELNHASQTWWADAWSAAAATAASAEATTAACARLDIDEKEKASSVTGAWDRGAEGGLR